MTIYFKVLLNTFRSTYIYIYQKKIKSYGCANNQN